MLRTGWGTLACWAPDSLIPNLISCFSLLHLHECKKMLCWMRGLISICLLTVERGILRVCISLDAFCNNSSPIHCASTNPLFSSFRRKPKPTALHSIFLQTCCPQVLIPFQTDLYCLVHWPSSIAGPEVHYPLYLFFF